MDTEYAHDRRTFFIDAGLAVLSGLMLGFSFPPGTLGVLACFGLVPLLVVLSVPQKARRALGLTYLAFLVFHGITLNWTGGYEHANDPYMMIAGAVTMTLHPFFYFIPVSLFLFIRNRLGGTAALISFPFLWVAYEYSHSLSEWSFPWLTIGNSHSYDLPRIQFISETGIFGLSFGILVMNVLAFVLFSKIAAREWRPLSMKSLLLALGIVLLYLLPKFHGEAVLAMAPPEEHGGLVPGQETITVGIVQANVDPWRKWKLAPFDAVRLYLAMTDSLLRISSPKPDLVLWPETAMPFRLLSSSGAVPLRRIRAYADSAGVSVLTGFPHMSVYADSADAPPSAKRIRATGERYDDFNAAAFIQPGVGTVPWYGKMKMVPLAERVPYADAFYFLDFLRWGVGIGGWQVGRDSTIFKELSTGTPFSCVICYESTYPDLVSAFVRKGAQFIAIITIDSWWGHMSGAFQHQQFAIFRAIENRRWIARCAVGGISCFIDPYGRVYDKTGLFEQALISRTIGRSDDLTGYARHGDWLAQGCVLFSGLFISAGVGQTFKNRYRRLQWKNTSI
jgi:apolipoprotein N-acyltransferase